MIFALKKIAPKAISLFSILVGLSSQAQAENLEPSTKGPSEESEWKASVGIAYTNQLIKRGLVTYGSDQLLPVLSLYLGNPQLFLSGTSLNYKMTPTSDLILRARLNYNSSYDQPFYVSKESLSERPHRALTSELDLFWEWKVLPDFELTGALSQDLMAHRGVFVKPGFRWILGNFHQGLIEPAIYGSFGYGTKAHNEYLYGAGSLTGQSFQTLGFSISCPQKVDSFYPILELTKNWLQRETVGAGAFVRDNEIENIQLFVWGAVRVF